MTAIQRQFDRTGLSYQRIEAVLGKNLRPDEIKAAHKRGPLGDLSLGDIGCFLSHRKAWQSLVDSGNAYAVVMEDDVIFGDRLKACLDFIPHAALDYDIIKLDRHGNSRHRVLLAPDEVKTPFGQFRHMLSKHTGGGAYLITQACARMALERSEPFELSIDHFLFNRNNSSFAHAINVQQLLPAAVSQGLLDHDVSDIQSERMAQRTYDVHYWTREAIRGFYEISDTPSIVKNMIRGARFEKIQFEA